MQKRHPAFRMPVPVKINGRASSITNAFVNGVIPCVHPTWDEVEEALTILGMGADDVQCIYCGGMPTEWDHLRPLVRNKQPTGFISEIANLVPSCGKCNQSKGARHWRDWMLGTAPRSPTSRGVPDVAERIEKLACYEAWRAPTEFDFHEAVGRDLWDKHWSNYERLRALMEECEETAALIRRRIAQRAS